MEDFRRENESKAREQTGASEPGKRCPGIEQPVRFLLGNHDPSHNRIARVFEAGRLHNRLVKHRVDGRDGGFWSEAVS
jgi:hypothetical protein